MVSWSAVWEWMWSDWTFTGWVALLAFVLGVGNFFYTFSVRNTSLRLLYLEHRSEIKKLLTEIDTNTLDNDILSKFRFHVLGNKEGIENEVAVAESQKIFEAEMESWTGEWDGRKIRVGDVEEAQLLIGELRSIVLRLEHSTVLNRGLNESIEKTMELGGSVEGDEEA